MKVISFSELVERKPLVHDDVILTIGVFDGFHRGHQSLVAEMNRISRKLLHAKKVLITFSRNPKTERPKNIDTLRLREENAEESGVDFFVIIDFSRDFSKTSACGFIEMLASSFNPVAVVVGEDFRFGNPMSGATAGDLCALFREFGKDVRVRIMQSILTEGGEKISSTLVRRVIENGEVECISALTGRSYRVDLMPVPYSIESGALVMCRSSIHQLLPPPGVYGAGLAFPDNHRYRVRAIIDSVRVTLVAEDGRGEEMTGEEMHAESIYFMEKRRNGIK